MVIAKNVAITLNVRLRSQSLLTVTAYFGKGPGGVGSDSCVAFANPLDMLYEATRKEIFINISPSSSGVISGMDATRNDVITAEYNAA